MKTYRFLLVAVCLIAWVLPGYAQNTNGNLVVATCGTPPSVYPTEGNRAPGTVNTDGELCAGVSVSASIDTAGLAVGVASGIATAGIVGTPIFVQASTIAPVYTAGGMYQPSMTMNGALRVEATVTPAANATVDLNLVKGGVIPVGVAGVLPVVLHTTSGTIGEIVITNGTTDVVVATNNAYAGGALVVAMAPTSGVIGAVTQSGTWNVGTVTAVTSITNSVTVTATNLDVQSGGADLATEATAAGILTSANFAAAFGTAGTADTQVMSIQGIASMTPVQTNQTQFGSTAVVAGATAGVTTIAPIVISPVTATGLTAGQMRSFAGDGAGSARVTFSNALAGYTSVVSATSSVASGGASGPTDAALVTVGATQRIIVHQLEIKCGSTVTNAITAAIGLGTANVPTSGSQRITAMPATTASQFQGFIKGDGYPSIIAVGAANEDLRLTMTNPSAGACEVSWVTTVEPA